MTSEGGAGKFKCALTAVGSMAMHEECMTRVGSAGEFKSALTAVGSIAMNEGPRGLFAGYQSFLLRDLPFDAIEFLAYEQLKVAYTTFLKGERAISPLETSAIGVLLLPVVLDIVMVMLMGGVLHSEAGKAHPCRSRLVRQRPQERLGELGTCFPG